MFNWLKEIIANSRERQLEDEYLIDKREIELKTDNAYLEIEKAFGKNFGKNKDKIEKLIQLESKKSAKGALYLINHPALLVKKIKENN